jgi:hypothetical protein
MRKFISIALGIALVIGGAWGFLFMLLSSDRVALIVWAAPISVFAFGCALLWEDVTGFFKGNASSLFTARVSGDLFDLGLDVKRLPDRPRQKFFDECLAVHTATKGVYKSKRLAMRFFVWYVVECPDFDQKAFIRDGVLTSSISIMKGWGQQDPELLDAAERESGTIRRYLHDKFETMDIPREQILEAQLRILEL